MDLTDKASQSEGEQKPATPQPFAAPSISLPKGGGAIRGMGEKFAANPVTGTGSMSVPIATSPGRSGFGPQLFLSYDSGSGNGTFGFGWSVSIPAITRKTDKGLPQYNDAEESDVFILSGSEDLVPVINPDGSRFEDTTAVPGYVIHRYRPRIEGLFARIERWTRADGDIHWRSISRDNILTLYGKDENSRIADPSDPLRIFSWLICETRDDKGNAVLYEYKAENGEGVDLSHVHEHNRGERDNPQRTANRYPERIRYGNRTPLLDDAGKRPHELTENQVNVAAWMFEVVFDYDEDHVFNISTDVENRTFVEASVSGTKTWTQRADPFSIYRAGFEVRTNRLCQRVLMFHHFADEPGVGNDCLVRSTDFTYSYEQDPTHARNPVYSFLTSVAQSGYKRDTGSTARYLQRSMPPVEFEYTQPIVQDTVADVDIASLENLPIGVDGATYQWTDLHGEGIPGILTEQADAWFYKRNISPISERPVEFTPLEMVSTKPNVTLTGAQAQPAAQFLDLAGDGQPDLVVMDGPMPGLYEHDEAESWEPFRPFTARLNRDMRDPNLRFIDLDGDGHADVLISEDDAFVWHASLAEEGFAPARRVQQALDEEKSVRLVFADGTESVYLADMSGDGLTDLVRIRNGEVCYWPNLGYCRFGAKVTMDHAPHFDDPDQFDQKRIRLADIDGTGTSDIIYLHRDGVRLYFNQSGNSWSEPQMLRAFPHVDDVVSIVPTDLLGNGTACLVWSSPLAGDMGRQMRYVDLMGGHKPHLLVKTINNLGAETRVHYASSIKFYLRDKYAGKPWITRLPFPVHVVERVETRDRISRNRFVTRYVYHHGYFDGVEREFRGFGMVEQWDTEELAALTAEGTLPEAANIDTASHVPPVLTKTWFHTGVYVGRNHVSDFFAGLLNGDDIGEYYREPELTDAEARERLLPDTIMPAELTLEEEREACRALKGAMLRQEVYALDGTDKEEHPYTVTEQNFTIKMLQQHGGNRYAVFFTHPREAISDHYERNPDDPRVTHALTLEVDNYGNILKQATVGYGRREPDMSLLAADRAKQTQPLITWTENSFPNAIETAGDYRTPLPAEARTYELSGLAPPSGSRLAMDEVLAAGTGADLIDYEESPAPGIMQKRLIEHVRTLYRPDDLGAATNNPLALLPLGMIESIALPGESYQLAFTPALVASVYGARVSDTILETEGRYVHSEGDANWWIPSGRMFFSPETNDTPQAELQHARQHFFLPHRFRDPFHSDAISTESFISYDMYDLLMLETRDAMDNRVTVGERDASGNLTAQGNDYRVLQPRLMMDPNRNRTAVAFDTLGMVTGTAVMGKPPPGLVEGDSLEDFESDLADEILLSHLNAPFAEPHAILQRATTRLVYDLLAYFRTRELAEPQPAVVYTLVRERHDAVAPGAQSAIQHSFSYSDGFGREIQKKIQAEAGRVPRRNENGKIIVGPDRQPEMTLDDVSPRWVGSGWTVFNNKGKPVRQYEPYFTDTHRFEFDVRIGVSPIIFYDPVERVVATLHPNHTWEKVIFDPWRQESWDVNDTALITNPANDADVVDFFTRLPAVEYLPTWHTQRIGGQFGESLAQRQAEQRAAQKVAAHAETPAVAHFDTLGRTFLTLADDGPNPAQPGEHLFFATRVELDIEGNQRAVRDAIVQTGDPLGRIVMRYDYDMLGTQIHSASMEAGERWMLNDVSGQPIRSWDSWGHVFRTEYDALHRPVSSFVQGSDPENPVGEIQFERTEYGEGQDDDIALNLRTRAFRVFDTAGIVTSEAYDFKGNLLHGTRQLATDYHTSPDWSGEPALEADIFQSSTAYDALNRPAILTTPDNSVVHPVYNEANLLERMEVNLRGSTTTTEFIRDIDYNAKGQRESIVYGNGARTDYEYDPLTFRLTRLQTLRRTDRLQDLSYVYDPVGNITGLRDDAQQTIYFNNAVVEPHASYTYDAIYRLIEATGREHIGQLGQPQTSWNDEGRTRLPHPNDGQAMRRYTEAYEYDGVGNFLRLIHQAANGGNWTREYAYEDVSLIEPEKQSNRLTGTVVSPNAAQPLNESYTHDIHGNMTRMPHLPLMQWDFKDQLQASSRQLVNAGMPEITWYVYDATGQRVRKVTERSTEQGETPTRRNERIYLGGFEVYREYEADGATVGLERETLHIMDDQQRVALVETRTRGDDGSSAQLTRYQLGNHLGSAGLELDADAAVISYEEYHPYGGTSYQAGRSAAEMGLKRYRYTGKERDEETGLNYHGARYYATWLGRWTATDPIKLVDGVNSYWYTQSNPILLVDGNGRWAEEPQEDDELPEFHSEGVTDEEWEQEALEVGDENVPQGRPIEQDPNYQSPPMSTAQAIAEGVGEGAKGLLVGAVVLSVLPEIVAGAVGGFALGYFLGSGEAEKTAASGYRVATASASPEDVKRTTAFSVGALGGRLLRAPKPGGGAITPSSSQGPARQSATAEVSAAEAAQLDAVAIRAGGGGGQHRSTPTSAASTAAYVPMGQGMSGTALRHRARSPESRLRLEGGKGPGNVAVAEVPLREGVKLRVSAANTPRGAHAEVNLAKKLSNRGIGPERVTNFYSDYSFCVGCAPFVASTFTRARFSYNTPYTRFSGDRSLFNYQANYRRQVLRSRLSDFLSLM